MVFRRMLVVSKMPGVFPFLSLEILFLMSEIENFGTGLDFLKEYVSSHILERKSIDCLSDSLVLKMFSCLLLKVEAISESELKNFPLTSNSLGFLFFTIFQKFY